VGSYRKRINTTDSTKPQSYYFFADASATDCVYNQLNPAGKQNTQPMSTRKPFPTFTGPVPELDGYEKRI
jgi:hypothetical protein